MALEEKRGPVIEERGETSADVTGSRKPSARWLGEHSRVFIQPQGKGIVTVRLPGAVAVCVCVCVCVCVLAEGVGAELPSA